MSVKSFVTSEHTSEYTLNRNEIVFRKRKNFFECGRSQKLKHKNLIIMHSEALSQFCASIGLKIDEIILSPYIESEISEIKVTILPEKKNTQSSFANFLNIPHAPTIGENLQAD